jgi:hypothetical protein
VIDALRDERQTDGFRQTEVSGRGSGHVESLETGPPLMG